MHVPFYLGAAAIVVGIVILTTGRHLLTPAEQPGLTPAGPPGPQPPATVPDRDQPAPGWVLLAVDGSPGAAAVTGRAARVAATRGVGVEVMHVRETDVIDTEAIDLEAGRICRTDSSRATGPAHRARHPRYCPSRDHRR